LASSSGLNSVISNTILKRLPVGRLKIDSSFVIGGDRDSQNAAIVETIPAMARIQQLVVTAEGGEQSEECDWLRQRGCCHIQGFLVSRPLKVNDFISFCLTFGIREENQPERRKP